MFGDLNKVMLMGNVTQDPDLRFTTGGTAVLNLSIATNRRYKQGEEWKDEVTYHNLVIWRNAESLAKRIKKGTRIHVEGRLQTRSWDNSEGKKQYKTEVVADNVLLVARYEGGSNDDLPTPEASSDDSDSSNSGNGSSKKEEIIDPDDLPF